MKRIGLTMVLALALTCTLACEQAEADIILVDGGGSAHATAVGTGTLTSIMTAAAQAWETAIPELCVFDVTINYSWAALGGGTLGVHSLTGQSGGRETSANLRFDNDGSSVFYLDSDTSDSSEWSTFTASTADYGGGSMNSGLVYTGALGLAAGRFDLYSIALHEIGHALGLSSANLAFQAENADGDIDITTGPYAGATLGTQNGAHLSISQSLMYPFFGASTRKLIADTDIWANAQISGWDMTAKNPVPEPGTLALVAFGGIFLLRRRRKHAAA